MEWWGLERGLLRAPLSLAVAQPWADRSELRSLSVSCTRQGLVLGSETGQMGRLPGDYRGGAGKKENLAETKDRHRPARLSTVGIQNGERETEELTP